MNGSNYSTSNLLLGIVLCGLFYLMNSYLFCQDINFHNFNVQNGLTSDEVFDLFQDDQKNIWIATSRGVVKYNGEVFFQYTTQNGLGGNAVFYIVQDGTKRIWFLPSNGVLSYYHKGEIFPYIYNDSIKKYIQNKFFLRSLAIHENALYIGTLGAGLFRIDTNGKIIDLSDGNHLNGRIFTVQEVGNTYLAHLGKGVQARAKKYIVRINESKGTSIHSMDEKGGMQNLFFIKRKNGDILISVYNSLYHFRNHQLIKEYKYSKTIISIYEDKDSNVWIGSQVGGVKCFSGRIGFDEKKHEGSYFNNLSISKTLQDQDDAYWFGSLEKGIFYIPEMNIKTLIDNTRATDGFNISKIATVQNKLYVGTNDGEIFILKNHQLQKKEISNTIPLGTISGFWDMNQGVYVTGSNRCTFISGKEKNKRYQGGINSACYDKNGNLYLCVNRAVLKVDNQSDTTYINNPTGSRFETVFCDSKNRIWLGGNIGLFTVINNEIVPVNILKSQLHITDLKEYNKHLLVATLGNGVLLLSENELSSYSTSNGLISDMVNTIVVEDNTYAWAGTSKGLCKINLLNHKIESIIDNRKGLPSNEIKMLALLGDTLFVGNNSFLSFFNTKALQPNNKDPQISVKGVKVNEATIVPSKKTRFGYDENNIEFTIHSYLYRELGNIEYKYRLKGLEDKFTYTNNNVIRFMFLPPGDYTFEAYALNEDRTESRIPVLYNFTIKQAYWKTTWFYVLIMGISVLIIGSVIGLYFRRLAGKRNFQLQLLESKQQAFTNQMNPHFIFNALNSVQTYILAENKTEALNYLGKFSKLMRQTLNNTRESMVSLASEVNLISHYVELEKSRYPGISYRINMENLSMEHPIMIPSMLIQPFIENSIKHGILKMFEKEGNILIRFFMKANHLHCLIEDDGIGVIEAGKIPRNADHTSAGMQITLDRLKLYCQTYQTPFRFIIKDKSETNSNISGTIVEFIIPYTLKHETYRNHY